ncbi:MAG: type III pantothenate kinase [Flavobacteriaceae bacterium]|nr:type III pantothenate kinase [Flavobacteriaceae bacterium]
MNIIIDVGNTRVKIALYQQRRLLVLQNCDTDEIERVFLELKKRYQPINKVIVSSVGVLNAAHFVFFKDIPKQVYLNHKTVLPFVNNYKTKTTLGVDRIALVSASVEQFPNHNVLIIDAGTCITYDFITKDNIYLGGSISPGIYMRYKSLNNLTANLPLLHPTMPQDIVGDSTHNAIHSGVIFGVLNEIDGTIDAYKKKNKDLTVILTGGDSKFLSKQLKNSIFANSNFLLEGLNYILEFNTRYD